MVICFLFQADRISFGKIKGFQRLVRDEKRFLSGPACFLFFVATFASIPFERRRLWFVRARFRVHKDGGQKQAKDSRHATCEDDLRARGTMSDPPFVWHPPSAEPPPPRETLFPRRPPFMRATRVASDRSPPLPLELRDFPSAFGELKTLLLEVETQFRWDSQQTTWEACADHWRRRVQAFGPGDADLAWRLSRALLGASTRAKSQKPFGASRGFCRLFGHGQIAFLFFRYTECVAYLNSPTPSLSQISKLP